MPYSVRNLQTKDLFRVVRIARGCSVAAREAFSGAVQTAPAIVDGRQVVQAAIDPQALAFAVFEAIVDQEAEVKALLADLAGLTVEQFDAEPLDAVLEIVGAVIEQDDLGAFLSKVIDLVSRATRPSATA